MFYIYLRHWSLDSHHCRYYRIEDSPTKHFEQRLPDLYRKNGQWCIWRVIIPIYYIGNSQINNIRFNRVPFIISLNTRVECSFISKWLQTNPNRFGRTIILWITSSALPFCQPGLSGSRNFIIRERKISLSVVSTSWYSRIRTATTRRSLEVIE